MPTPHAASPQAIVKASTTISTRAPRVRFGRTLSAKDTIRGAVGAVAVISAGAAARRAGPGHDQDQGRCGRTSRQPQPPRQRSTPRASWSRGRNRRRSCGFPRSRRRISRKITRRDRPAGTAERCNKYNAASRKMDILDGDGKALLVRFCYFGIQRQWFSDFVAIHDFIPAVQDPERKSRSCAPSRQFLPMLTATRPPVELPASINRFRKAAGLRIVRVQSKCGAEFCRSPLRCAHPTRGPCQGWNAHRPAGDCR